MGRRKEVALLQRLSSSLLVLFALSTGCVSEEPAIQLTGTPLDGEQVGEIVEGIAETFETVYVLPEVGDMVASQFRQTLGEGATPSTPHPMRSRSVLTPISSNSPMTVTLDSSRKASDSTTSSPAVQPCSCRVTVSPRCA